MSRLPTFQKERLRLSEIGGILGAFALSQLIGQFLKRQQDCLQKRAISGCSEQELRRRRRLFLAVAMCEVALAALAEQSLDMNLHFTIGPRRFTMAQASELGDGTCCAYFQL